MSARFPAAWLRLWRERKSERPTLNCPTKGPDRGLQCLGDLAPRLTRRSTSADVLAIEKPQRSADWPAAPSTSFLSAPEPGYDAIPDKAALELGDRTEHMEMGSWPASVAMSTAWSMTTRSTRRDSNSGQSRNGLAKAHGRGFLRRPLLL